MTGKAGALVMGALCAGALVLLAGCEAPLVLDAVEETRRNPVHRTDNFQAVGASGRDIVAVGTGGIIVASQDNGNTWQRHEIPSWPSFLDVTGCDNGLFAALAFEGEVWVSGDRGRAWSRRRLDTDEAPQAIRCDPAGNLWVVGSFSTISVSRDGGESWTVRSRDEDVIYTDIQFFDEQTAYIVGEFGAFLKTADGGGQWEALPPMPNEFYPQGMYFQDLNRGWVAGLGGLILMTSDGGRTWEEQLTGSLATLYTLAEAGGHVFVVGGEGSLFRHTGAGWTEVRHGRPFRLYLRGLQALPGRRLIVSGNAGVLHIFSVDELLGQAALAAAGSRAGSGP